MSLYVADTSNHRIRKITNNNTVTTIAGNGAFGFLDGSGTNTQFKKPYGITCDPYGNLYIADTENHCIRKITSDGTVTTIAGNGGTSGFADGVGTSAQFSNPSGITCDSFGNLYIADTENNRIRKIMCSNGAWTVLTIAGNENCNFNDGNGLSAEFCSPYGIICDSSGTLYVTGHL